MPNIPASTDFWSELRLLPPKPHAKKMAWRLLRQFVSDEQIEAEFACSPTWLWSIDDSSARQGERAIKLLLSNESGVRCETVLLLPDGPVARPVRRRRQRATACVSSQPGCGVGCPFCSTATLGYRGNFSSPEILEQVLLAGRLAKRFGRSLKNVVYMGMGEPLHNAAAVFDSLLWLTADGGFGLSPRRITVSTAGVPSAMLELARRFPRVRLALSLHSAEPDLRRRLVPRAIGDLQLLRETISQVNCLQRQPVWLEVVLFAGLNDSGDDARRLVEFSKNLRVEVNLIPYNIAADSDRFSASSRERREAFARVLREAGLRTTLRSSFGSASQAACGQLTAGVGGGKAVRSAFAASCPRALSTLDA